MTEPLWRPSATRIAKANLTEFAARVSSRHGISLPDYTALYAWSIADRESFWREMWDYAGVIGERGARVAEDATACPARTGFRMQSSTTRRTCFGVRALDDASDALVFWGEDKVKRRMSHAELYASVSRVAQALRAAGVGVGDRVAGYLPNMPEAIVATLAASAIGAIWSSASPDFGVQGVLDRFGQIEPKILFTVDGYWYNGKPQPILDKVARIAERLPSLLHVVVAPYLGRTSSASESHAGASRIVAWDDFLGPHAAGRDRVRAAAVRSSLVHHVLVGDDRCAEVHRPRRGGYAAAAPEGTPPAQ